MQRFQRKYLLLFMTRGMSLEAWRASGSLQRELALYAALSGRGVRTAIISWGGKEDTRIAAAFPWLKVCVNRFSLPQAHYERLLPFLHAPVILRADIIKSNQVDGADVALRCAQIWKKPFIARCGYMWSFICEKQAPQLLPEASVLEARIFTEAQAVVSTTEEHCRYIGERYGVSTKNIHRIPNYVPDSFYAANTSSAEAGAMPVITQVGRLAPEKNLFALVQACTGLKVRLRLIGDGPERAALTKCAAECGVSLEITGNVPHEQLPQLLAQSAVCALVSHFEGHPKALIEYMACGRPVLATDVPGISPLVEQGTTGLLCQTDTESIRQGLQALLDDAELRIQLGKNAREYARRFSLGKTVDKEWEVYLSLPKVARLHSLTHGVTRMATALARFLARRFKAAPAGFPAGAVSLAHGHDALAGLLPDAFAARCVGDIQAYIAAKTPAEALKVLFAIDEKLYAVTSGQAIAYDGGVHTKHRHTRYHDFFVDRLKQGEEVLDIGCGNGFLAYDMAAKGKALVTGIDMSKENIALAQKRFAHPNVTYVVGDALKDLPQGRIETVVLSNVLEHLPERPAFLRGVLRSLQPKRLLARVPLFERDWRVPLKRELGMEWRLDPTHETEYTLESFQEEATEAGLAISHLEIRWSEIWCELKPR